MSTRSIIALVGGITAAALFLSSCGTGADPGTSAEPSAMTSTSEPSPPSTPLSQAEWVEMCGPEGTDPGNPRCTEDKEALEDEGVGEEDDADEYSDPYLDEEYQEPVGEWLQFTTTDDENYVRKWEVKVDSVELTETLPDAKSNPDWDGGEEIPQYIEARANEGNEFLHAKYSVKNTTGVPGALSLESAVVFSDSEMYGPYGEFDTDYAWNLTQAHDVPAGDDQNPNTVSEGDFVIEIPKNSEISSLVIYQLYGHSEFELVVGVDL